MAGSGAHPSDIEDAGMAAERPRDTSFRSRIVWSSGVALCLALCVLLSGNDMGEESRPVVLEVRNSGRQVCWRWHAALNVCLSVY